MFSKVFLVYVVSSRFLLTSATVCFTCNKYDHPRNCVHVTKCSANQKCYVESNVTQAGQVTYTSGCMDSSECQAILHAKIPGDMIVGKRSGTVCKLCCHEDYCNSELCDIHREENIGPRCLSCKNVNLDQPRDCLSITQCAKDEICYTEHDGKLYQMGCIVEKNCRLDNYKRTPHRYSRTPSSCAKCCDASYCNAELCGNSTLVNPDFKVFEVSQIPTFNTSSGTCDDSSYEACQYFIHSHGDSCQDINMQRICPKSCGICVDKSCVDNATFDCAVVDRSFNICQNLRSARQLCRKHCGYCNYENGAWTSWSDWSNDCSRSCGKSTKRRSRTCTNPAPKYGGDQCQGDKVETQHCRCGRHTGKSYAIIVPFGSSSQNLSTHLIISSEFDTQITMRSSYPALDKVFNVTSPGKNLTLPVDIALSQNGSTIQSKGIILESTEYISVYVFHEDGYLALPSRILGKKYKSITTDHTDSFIAIMPYGGSASVSLMSTDGVAPQTINIPELSVFYFWKSAVFKDVMITSNQTVAVITGHYNSLGGIRQSIFDMILPIKTWNMSYIVPFSKHTSRYDFLYTTYPIKITYFTSDPKTTTDYTVNLPYKYISIPNAVSYFLQTVQGTFAVVLWYYQGTSLNSFMCVVPSLSQFSNNYQFWTPFHSNNNFIAVIMREEDRAGLLVDEMSITKPDMSHSLSTLDGLTYKVLTVAMDHGWHSVRHDDPAVQFGLIMYGGDKNIAYGLPLGYGID